MNRFPITQLGAFAILVCVLYFLMYQMGRTHQRIESDIEDIASNLRESSKFIGKMQSSLREGDEALTRIESQLRRLKNTMAKASAEQEPAEELPFPRYMASEIPWGPHIVAAYIHEGMSPGDFWTFEQIESAWAEGDPSIIRIVPPDWMQGVAPMPELIPLPKESKPCEN